MPVTFKSGPDGSKVDTDDASEKKKAAKAADLQCAQDDTKNTLARMWEDHVLPHWDQVIREPRTRELWWRGVAPSARAKVWDRAVGNELGLTDQTYAKALQRAQDLEKRMSQARPEELCKEQAWFRAIRRDMKNVFPELKIFQPGGPFHDGLLDVLMAYSIYRSDVGYSHGTHVSSGHRTRSPSDHRALTMSHSLSPPSCFSPCPPRRARSSTSPISSTDRCSWLFSPGIHHRRKEPTT